MKRYSFGITFTPTAYANNDTTKIHHVYKSDFAVCVPFFHDRKSGPVCHQIGRRVRSSFLSGQWMSLCLKRVAVTRLFESFSVEYGKDEELSSYIQIFLLLQLITSRKKNT